jgi:acyl-CoA reductase-like NAD-dependent aldehyde dehydrogenase
MAIAEQDLAVIKQEQLQSLNPATGEVVATFPIAGPDEVRAAVERARAAAAWWQGLGFAERRRRLLAFKGVVARRSEELADLVRRENGKPVVDAMIETVTAIDHLDWAAKNAERIMSLRKMKSSLNLINHAAFVEELPLDVIGVIGPWNYPVHTPMGSITYALAAGNAVVYKPSEYTPAIGQWLCDAFASVVSEQPVFQIVHGYGQTGAALCTSGVNKIAFTGSARTGRKIMAACADSLTPVLMELGGKDALIVDDDANVEAAADAAVWGAMQNAGQACVSVERAYVHEKVYDQFVNEAVRIASGLRAGDDPLADLGPITMPGQIDIIKAHLDDAFARGAKALVGGPDSVHAPYVDPVVLVDVPEDALILKEETFGPVLPIVKVRDADDAVAKANNTAYGLGNTVWGKKRAMDIARRLRSGMVAVNGIVTYAGMPSLPFGGIGESGFGRIHGEDGLKEFTLTHAITKERFTVPLKLLSFQRPAKALGQVTKLTKLVHGRS